MKSIPVPQLGHDPDSPFPDPRIGVRPDGLLAFGGDLHPVRLLNAYRQGIFPWYEAGGPILWWSPEPRAVLLPGHLHVSRRLRRTLRQGRFRVGADTDFDAVVSACAGPRDGQDGTWITPDMQRAYGLLHQAGYAHSVEIQDPDGELIGGLYGVALGRIFFAESKFHRSRDASKIALAVLMRCLDSWNYWLCDCQIWNPHLERMGVRLLSGRQFHTAVTRGVRLPTMRGPWTDAIRQVNLADW